MIEEIWKRLAAFTDAFLDVIVLPFEIIKKILKGYDGRMD